jgi:hypothetical protein
MSSEAEIPEFYRGMFDTPLRDLGTIRRSLSVQMIWGFALRIFEYAATPPPPFTALLLVQYLVAVGR